MWPSPFTSQARPRRGAKFVQRDGPANEFAFTWGSPGNSIPIGAFGYTVLFRPFSNHDCWKFEILPCFSCIPRYGSHRMPALTVSREVAFHVSCRYRPM